MSDTTLRLAEACERAANELTLALQHASRSSRMAAPEARETAIQLRALAAALRGAKPYDFDTQHRDDQFILTIGDV